MPDVAGPSWMRAEEWAGRLIDYRRQGRTEDAIVEIAAYLEMRGPRKPRRSGAHRPELIPSFPGRADFATAHEEAAHCVRGADGRPMLALVHAGDRMGIWSPAGSGALINPKGPGLRSLGLVVSYVRGAAFHPGPYRRADLRPGRRVLLRRDPMNEHDPNAVAFVDDLGRTMGFVQRGKVGRVARRMDAGEKFAAVSIWGPGPRNDDITTLVLLGEVGDIEAML